MHSSEDEKLIANIIERICTNQQQQSVVSPKPGFTKLSEEQLSQSSIKERSKETLVILSQTKFELVLQGLIDKLAQPGLTEEDQLTLLDLLVKCLAIPWNLIKKKFQILQNEANEQPAAADTKISDTIATKALDLIMVYLTKPPAGKSSDEISPFTAKAGNILFYLSAFSDAPYNRVISIIQTGVNEKDNDETSNLYSAMEYLNVNSKRLSNIFHKIHQITGQYAKKGAHQIFLARVLRKTIWNWIDNYPKEFVQLYKSGNRLDGNPDTLFELFNDWSSNSSKAKNSMWPLQTMLLVCCPDTLSKLSQNKAADDNPSKFLDALKKAFKSGKLADIAAICFVDISKAATFLPAMEPSPLRALGPALQIDLDEKLFDPKSPFKNSDGDIDIKLMTESLVASFRLSPNKVLNTLLPEFLKPDAPYHFKISLVNAFLRITNEGPINPWSPTLGEVYSSVSAKMRNLFLETVHSASQILAGDQSKRTKAQQEKLTSDLQILDKLIALFHTDPKLPLFPTGIIAQDVDATKNFLLGIVECINKFSTPEISDAASVTLLEFHKPIWIEKWVPKSVVASFWEISSCVNIALSNILIDGKELKPQAILKVISLLEEILSRRNNFLRSQQNEDVTKLQELRMQSTTKLEITVLINLCNGDPEICTKAATCLGLLCDEIDIVGTENASVISTNYQVYRRIAASGVLTTGRVAQQLGIRKLLRKVDRPTSGNFAAWQEVYERWDVYTQVVKTFTEETVNDSSGNLKKGKSGKDLVLPKVLENKLPMEIQQEWHNITGFLLALSGVALNRELTAKPVKFSSPATSADPKKFKTSGSNSVLGSSSNSGSVKSIDSFMDEICDLMLFDTKNVRESIMSLTAVLTRNLIQTTQKFFGTAGQINTSPKSTLFVDQSVSLVKHIIELQQESDNLSLLSDLEILLESLAKYISQLEVEETTLKIRKTFCTLLDSIMQRKQSISFRNELKFRNILIDVLLGWTSDFAEKKFEENGTNTTGNTSGTQGTASSLATGLINAPRTLVRTASSAVSPPTPAPQVDMGKLFKELDVEAMKAMASLLRGLPLNAGEGNDPQALERKKQRFVKYFSYFTKLLTRCKEESRVVAKKPNEKKSALADFAINCLSNLLAANIDSGLQYFVTMGYHEDFETRTAFLKVIANILNQGTEFDQTGEESEKYDKLIELLIEPDQSVVIALCEATQITEADDVAGLLIRLFESYEKTMPLLKSSIEYEIGKTEQSTTLFRRNSMTTKLLAAYSKVMGREYLKEVIQPFIQSWQQNPVPCEINPEKLPKGESIETNIANLTRLCQQLLNSFQASIERCPSQLREVCKMLKDSTHDRFPGCEPAAIGSFIFLRFICPAIVSPEGFGIVNEISSNELRRSLVLVSKCINNLASGVTFEEDKKEPYMKVMNPFITNNLSVCANLLEKFATLSPNNRNSVSLFSVNEEQKESDLASLHHYLAMYLEKVTRHLQQTDQQRKTNAFDRLTVILQKLGAPPEITHNKPSVRATIVGSKVDNSLYDNFMRTMGTKNTDKIKEMGIYYKQGVSKEKHPVFYLIARKFNTEMDMELLLYYILKTTQSSFSKPYVLVIDATLFTLDNGLSPSWCAYFIKHFPVVASDNLHQLIIVNPSHELKKYSKRISKFIGRASKKIVFITNATKLNEYISDSEIGLPTDTLSIEKDVKHSFTPVIKVSRQQFFQKEIVLRISGDYLQLLWVKPAPIFGVNTQLMDLFFLPTIEQIESSPEEYEFLIKYRTSSGSKSITLRSPSCKAIIQAINGARNIHKLTTDKFSGHKLRNPSDVPGTLLNMALINLGSGNEQLRVAAYNMLHSLSTNFQFSIRLHEAEGLCIPSNSFNFIVDLSEQLALTQINLTLEFLLECLQGLSTSKPPPALKHLVLDYMRPWLPNLKKFYRLSGDADSSEKVAKTKEVFNSLVEFTISESSIQTLILMIIWETIGNVPDLIGTVLEVCLEKGFKSGVGSSQVEVICSIINSLASQNPKIVSGKLIHRLLNMLQQTNSIRIDEDALWPNISVMLRILFALSFYNHLHVQQYLPELFHLVIMLFCNGTSDIRATLYGLLINIVHSLYSVIPEEKYQGLRFHMSELSQPQVKLHFGIGGQSVTAYSKPDLNEKKLDKVSMNAVETVTNVLYSILSSVSSESHVIESTWHARWRSLITQSAFTPNFALQGRACVALGVICKSRTLVTDDLLELVLESLRSALRETMNGTDHDMSVALLMCLSHLYEYLPASSPYFKTIFWVAMAIIQISDEKLFSASLSLIQVVLKIQDNEGFERGLEETYMEVRDGPVDQILTKLEQLTGISFKSSFSFAVAGNLLKGLKYSKAKESTSRVLTSLLDISAKSAVGGNILGYLAALLPVEGEIPILRDLPIGGSGKDLHQYFFSTQLLPDVKHGALLFTFLITILQSTEKEHEQEFIYYALKEGVSFMPEAFCVIEDILVPMMSEVILKSQNESLIESVHSITQSLYTFKQNVNSNKLNRSYLNDIGYHKLPNCSSFDIEPEIKREITKIVILLLDNLLKEVRSKK